MPQHPVLCIDGPAAVGKSTVSHILADRLHWLHVDSGALYRSVTWHALQAGVDCGDTAAVERLCDSLRVEFVQDAGAVVSVMNGIRLTDEIRTAAVNAAVSPVATAPGVRARVTGWLREMRNVGPIVVEGRDIGSVVYPDSPLRFYLDADPEVRARRRHLEQIQKGLVAPDASQDATKASLLNRDRIDSTRKTAPLKIADGATVIDTTNMTIEEVVQTILDIVRKNGF